MNLKQKFDWMKWIGFAVLSISISGCLILNPLGIHAERTSGADAKDRIFMAALTGEILISAALSGGGSTLNLRGLFYSTIADDLANVDGNKYYLTPSVDQCVSSIEEASILVILAGRSQLADTLEYKRIFTPSLVCNLEEDGVILGKPFPKI